MLLAILSACGGSGESDKKESGGKNDGGAQGATPSSDSSPVYGGEATFLIDQMFNYFDPAIDERYGIWMESLWAIDWGLNDPDEFAFNGEFCTYRYLAGQIATDTSELDLDAFNETGDLTVKLRDDVYFQKKDAEYDLFKGRKVTAADVKYSYDRLLGFAEGQTEPYRADLGWPQLLGMIESIEAADDTTVVFHFRKENITESDLDIFMRRFVNITGPEWDTLSEEQKNDWRYAVGTGPYVLTDYAADSFLTFTRNEEYYDYDERFPENKLPYIDKVSLVLIKDTATIMTQFISGTLDWFSNSVAYLSNSEKQQLRDSAKGYTEITYNSVPALTINLKCNQKPFNDVRVRKAMQMSIDCEAIHRDFYGYTNDMFLPGIWNATLTEWATYPDWDEELMSGYTYDPEGAKELLAEAGYPDGFSFDCVVDPMSDMDLYLLAQSYFKAVGIDMKLEQVSDMMESFDVLGNKDDPRQVSNINGQVTELNMGKTFVDPTGPRYSIFEEDEAVNKEITDIMNNLAAASSEGQAEYARQADKFIAAQHWWILLGGVLNTEEFYSEKLHGYTRESMFANKNMRTMASRIWVE
jgi:peptide/nickel transport system substrate-binding protein